MKFNKWFTGSLVVLALLVSTHIKAEIFVEGRHYQVIANPGIPEIPGKIEVREFFWYGCPHCFSLEGKLQSWKKNLANDVSFITTPAVAAPHWKPLGAAYYAAESLKIKDQSHSAMFNALHRDKQRIQTPEQIAAFYSQFGVEQQAFLDQMESFSVKTSLRKAESLFRQYQLTGVPAIIVNGKYQPVSSSYDEMLRIVDFLIEKERMLALQNSR